MASSSWSELEARPFGIQLPSHISCSSMTGDDVKSMAVSVVFGFTTFFSSGDVFWSFSGSGRFEFKFAELVFSEKCFAGDWKKVTDLR